MRQRLYQFEVCALLFRLLMKLCGVTVTCRYHRSLRMGEGYLCEWRDSEGAR